MPPSSSSSESQPGSRTWRNRSQSTTSIRHRWQARGQDADPRMSRRSWRRILVLGGMLLTCLVTLGLFAFLLLFSPKKTPMLTLVAVDYAWPYQPNAWAREDHNRLLSLNGRSIEVYPVGQDQMRRNEWLADFTKKLALTEYEHGRKRPTLIYISMHGGVDSNGIPCLIPPNSSPLDASTWIPLPEVLAEIRRIELSPDHPVVLFLDCSKMLANWDRGVIYNSFAAALANVVADAGMSNLYVFNSTSSGQQAEASELLQGSIFGESLFRALSGAADERLFGGNADRQLHLSEVVEYVQKRVTNWSAASRGRTQSPLLIPDRGTDILLCWSMHNARTTQLPQPDEERLTRLVDRLYATWQNLENLPQAELLRRYPVAATRLRQDLAWCEQALQGGEYYLPRVEELLTSLQQSLDLWQRQLVQGATDSAPQFWREFPGPKGHTLALNVFFQPTRSGSQHCRETLNGLIDNYSAVALDQTLTALPEECLQFADVRFLKLAQQMTSPRTRGDRVLMTAALSTQRQLREAIAISDLRVVEHLQHLWAELEVRRRELEDRLLTGQSTAAEWQALLADVTRRHTLLTELTGYFELSDRAACELPFYARWLADPDHNGSIFRTHVELAEGELTSAFDSQRIVLAMLGEIGSDNLKLDEQRFRTAAESLRASLETLQQKMLDEMTVSASESSWQIEQLDANQGLLRVPLLFPPDRQSGQSGTQQRKALFQLTGRMLRHFETSGASGQRSGATFAGSRLDQASQDDSLRALLGTTSNLVRNLIATGQPDENTAGLADDHRSIEKLQDYIRSVLEAAPEQARLALEQARVAGDHSRALLWPAANRARQLASYWSPGRDTAATAELQQFDARSFVLWQWQSALDDFWGGPDELTPPFFLQAGQQYLDYCTTVERSNVEQTLAVSERKMLQSDRVRAARSALSLTADRSLVIDAQLIEPLRFQLHVADATVYPKLPPLTGQVRVQTGAAEPVQAGVAPVHPGAAPVEPLTQLEWTPAPGTLGSALPEADTVTAEFQFRGHTIRIPVPLTRPAGQTARIDVTRSSTAEVTVLDSQSHPISVMLVLDCSQSMNQSIAWEASATELSKFDAARNASRQILTALSSQPDVELGLILYGHRVGWNTASPTQILRQTDYGRPIPDLLAPYEDTELVLPFGRFGQAENQAVSKLLDTVKPWGETPLYLSLRNALRELRQKSQGTRRQIIVITDGVNQQLNPSADAYVGLSDLLAEDFTNTEVNIIGFGIEQNQTAAAARQFDQIARRTGGQYLAINDAGRLLSQLSEYFRKQPFTLATAARNYTQPTGTPVQIPLSSPATESATVTYAGQSVTLTLSPGDNVQLLSHLNSRQLTAVGYLQRAPVFADLSNSLGLSPLQLGVHRPVLNGNHLEVQLSMQDRRQRPVSRPQAYWVELAPVIDQQVQPNQVYRVAGQTFVPGKPAPVLKLLARNWPAGATGAQVRAAILPNDPTSPPRELTLDQLKQNAPLQMIDAQISQNDPQTLLVVRHVSAVHLMLSESSRMIAVSREYDPRNQLSIDRFHFDRPLDRTALEQLRFHVLQVEPSRWIENFSMPLTVPVDVEQSLLPRTGPIPFK